MKQTCIQNMCYFDKYVLLLIYKKAIYCWFWFFNVVQKQALGKVKNKWSFDGLLCQEYLRQKLI